MFKFLFGLFKMFDRYIVSLFCKHKYITIEEFPLFDLKDSILIEECELCQKERARLMGRKSIFGQLYSIGNLPVKLARTRIEQLKALYKIECVRDWTIQENE